jgi:hypothetical protein
LMKALRICTFARSCHGAAENTDANRPVRFIVPRARYAASVTQFLKRGTDNAVVER